MPRNTLVTLLAVLGLSAQPGSPPAARAIEIWHGDTQRVGHLGDAQDDFNLMGRVRPWQDVDTLFWRIATWQETPLAFRAFRRLIDDGDFNADIPIGSLQPGPNSITITARFKDGQTLAKTVKVVKEPGARPLPVKIRWKDIHDPQEAGQYVDGQWTLDGAGLRTSQVGYDRVFLIGERSWRDYEVRTSITLHRVSAEVTPVSGGNGVGVIMRFAGHVVGGHRHFPASQPKWGYQPFGSIGWLRWDKDGADRPPRLQFYPGESDKAVSFEPYPIPLEQPYFLIYRCETLPDVAGRGVTRYSFKIWPAGDPEPGGWTWEQVQSSAAALRQGGVALLAHHVDVTFGDVEVQPF